MKKPIPFKEARKMNKDEFVDKAFGKNEDIKKFILLSDFNPKTGRCSPVPIEILEEHKLGFGNGASWARDDGALGIYFNILRIKEKGSIVAVEICGYKKDFKHRVKQQISARVKKALAGLRCRICARKKPMEEDHKGGRKNEKHFDENDSNFFQALCKGCNDRKRAACIRCKKTDKRPDARKLPHGFMVGWQEGDEKWVEYFQDSSGGWHGGCHGCYYHDIEKWNRNYGNTQFLDELIKKINQQKELDLAPINANIEESKLADAEHQELLKCATTSEAKEN